MVINITLGRVTLGPRCGFACTGLLAVACAKVVTPRASVITTADKKVERRRNMRLLRRQLLRAPRLLVCFRRESLGGQGLG